MDAAHGISSIGVLLGDPTRAIILASLLDGRAWTAGELARISGVTPQTASSHLAMLVDAQLLSKDAQGRHRYFRLASEEVARSLEGLISLAVQRKKAQPFRTVSIDPLRDARTCYDHLAGKLGVAVTEGLLAKHYLIEHETDFAVSDQGLIFFAGLGIEPESLHNNRRAFARKCLDWSERRYHLAGALGAELNKAFFQRQWLQRLPDSRAVRLTTRGRSGLKSTLAIDI
jgi:DNA-binding transcriptional ArsR family regulator